MVQALSAMIPSNFSISSWHTRQRTMDELSLYVRIFREVCAEASEMNIDPLEWSIMDQLTAIFKDETNSQMPAEEVHTIRQAGVDTSPTLQHPREWQFAFGMLDTIQESDSKWKCSY